MSTLPTSGRLPSQLPTALAAIEAGRHIFPLCRGSKKPGREMTHWEQRASNDADHITLWWTFHPFDNVAIACGPSRLVVVDLDLPKPGQKPPKECKGARHGLDVFATLAAAHGQALPIDTYTLRTPSGGVHLYFTAPAGLELRSTWSSIGWLIDTRAAGGYVVAAGSIVDGRPYLVESNGPVAELPAWLTPLLSAPSPAAPAAPVAPIKLPDRYAQAALDAEMHRAATAPKGQRHRELNKAAWNLSRHVAAGRLDRGTVEAALQQAGEAAGRAPNRVTATIRSALNAGLRRHQGGAGR